MGHEALCAQNQNKTMFQHDWLCALVQRVEGSCSPNPSVLVLPLPSALPEHACGAGSLLGSTQQDTKLVHWDRMNLMASALPLPKRA